MFVFGPDAASRLAAFARGAEAGVASIPDTKSVHSIADVDFKIVESIVDVDVVSTFMMTDILRVYSHIHHDGHYRCGVTTRDAMARIMRVHMT